MASHFTVDPKALHQVADKVEALLAEISGGAGYIAGNAKEFQSASSIGAPLATFWGTAENVFAGAYGDAHGAITTTFQQIQQQLRSIAQAARGSAQSYQDQDQTSQREMKQTLPSHAK
jgi:uncharacterized phage infection (PIP) family protein YhgE